MTLERFTSLQPVRDLPQLTAALERQQRPQREGGERGWYTITNRSEAEAEITIYDFMGSGGVSADDFIHELGQIKANKITLRVNSPGGDVFDGIAIFNALHRHKARVTAFVDGIAASAASFVIMAADEIVMSPHSTMMIHEAHGLTLGAAADMRKMADVLDKSSDNIAAIYAARTGRPVAEWRALMVEETWFSDQEAVTVGLADRVDGEDENAVAARMEARVQNDAESTLEPSELQAIHAALQKGTAEIVRKPVMPDYDFAAALKEATAVLVE